MSCQLRSFKAFDQSAPVLITFPDLNSVNATTAGRVPALPLTLIDLDGLYDGTVTTEFLQLFDLAATSSLASGTTVPLKSFAIPIAGPGAPLASLFQQLGGIKFNNGIVIAVSSTELVYTTSSSHFSVFGEVVEWEMPQVSPSGTTISSSGDLSTARNTLQVWAEATPATDGELYLVIVRNALNDATTRYLRIEPSDNAVTGLGFTVPIPIAPNGGVKVFHQGAFGRAIPYGFDGNPNSLKKGCTLRLVNSQVAAYQQTNNSGNIFAFYS